MDKDKPSNQHKGKSSAKGREGEPQQAPDKGGAKPQEAARKGGQHGQGGRAESGRGS